MRPWLDVTISQQLRASVPSLRPPTPASASSAAGPLCGDSSAVAAVASESVTAPPSAPEPPPPPRATATTAANTTAAPAGGASSASDVYPSVSSPSSPAVRVCPAAALAAEAASSRAFPLVSAVPSQSQAVLAPRMRLPSLYHSSSLLLLRLGIPPLTGVSLFSLAPPPFWHPRRRQVLD